MTNRNIGYDETKKMLNTLRNLSANKSSFKTIKEDVTPQDVEMGADATKDDVTVINNVDVKLLFNDDQDKTFKDEQKQAISGLIDNFKQQVSQVVDFEPGFTISPDQIRLDGTLTDEDISFVFIVGEESGVYINAEMLKLEQNVGDKLEKLAKFEETFKTTLEPILTQRNTN